MICPHAGDRLAPKPWRVELTVLLCQHSAQYIEDMLEGLAPAPESPTNVMTYMRGFDAPFLPRPGDEIALSDLRRPVVGQVTYWPLERIIEVACSAERVSVEGWAEAVSDLEENGLRPMHPLEGEA